MAQPLNILLAGFGRADEIMTDFPDDFFACQPDQPYGGGVGIGDRVRFGIDDQDAGLDGLED